MRSAAGLVGREAKKSRRRDKSQLTSILGTLGEPAETLTACSIRLSGINI